MGRSCPKFFITSNTIIMMVCSLFKHTQLLSHSCLLSYRGTLFGYKCFQLTIAQSQAVTLCACVWNTSCRYPCITRMLKSQPHWNWAPAPRRCTLNLLSAQGGAFAVVQLFKVPFVVSHICVPNSYNTHCTFSATHGYDDISVIAVGLDNESQSSKKD